MKIYQLWFDYKYRPFVTVNENGYKAFQFEGKPIENWSAEDITPSMEKESRDLSVGNVYGVDISAVVIDDKCFDVLIPLINNHAQVFQTRYENNLAYVLNITEIIDCLDYEHSKLKFFKSSGRLMRVEEYAFDKTALDDAVIFKIPEELKAQPYVTDQFKKIIENNEIKGFEFKLVWECD